jgi:hypothetical protein
MEKNARDTERNGEITTFFYLIFGNRLRQGLSQADARSEACEAVTLRYGISRGRMLNILSEYKGSRQVNLPELQKKALDLLDELRVANEEIEAMKGRNEKLISYLEECVQQ